LIKLKRKPISLSQQHVNMLRSQGYLAIFTDSTHMITTQSASLTTDVQLTQYSR